MINCKKSFLLGILFLCCTFCIIDNVKAGSCDVNIKPATYCNTDSSKNVGYFSDPSLSTIKNNNCSKFTTTINEYCKSYCREEAVVNYPSTINPLSVDKYQPILGGSHFIWEKTSIMTKRECVTEINYDQWQKDYEYLERQKQEVTLQLLREWHQVKSDRVIGNCKIKTGTKTDKKEVPVNEYQYSPPIDGGSSCHNQGGEAGSLVDHNGQKQCRYGGGCPYYSDKWNPEDVSQEVIDGVLHCYVTTTSEVYKYGKLHQYTKVTYHDSTPSLDKSATYCDALGTKPYWDTGQIDKYWSDVYKTLINNINGKISALRKCNSVSSFNYNSTPKVTVHYKDPTGNYNTNNNGRDITLNTKLDSSISSSTGTVKASQATSGLLKVNCKTVSGPSDATEANLRNACTTTYTREYDSLRNTSVAKSITNKYSYTMPSNIFRYTLKETGEAVDSNSSKVTQAIKDNYRYVDVGYPNYPVHYTTPSGEYPIYLTYQNLGSNGYFTNFLRNKMGRYDCTYKVTNRIIPDPKCPDPECPPDDKCTPGNPECPYNPPNIPGNPDLKGINVIYRPISLVDPFPDYSAKGRKAGENWSNKDIQDYIINNRGVKSNNVYNKAPIYTFTLDAKAIRAIKNYNNGKDSQTHKKREYNDFNLTCSSQKNGKRCLSKFLKSIKTMIGNGNASGKCLGASSGNFYSCADKPNQDNIKCGLNANNKMECTDCNLAANKGKDACKGSGQ